MKLYRVFKVFFVLLFIACGTIAANTSVRAYSPIYTNNANYQGANIRWIQIDLQDSRTYIQPQGASNHLPLYTTTTTQPLWDDSMNHVQDLLQMYNGATVPAGVTKYGLINTDYFCTSGCTAGTQGAPQGLFVRGGTKYHYPGPHKRAALLFNGSNVASIAVYTGNPSTAGISNAVSGGPVQLRNGTITCNPDGEDVPASHCGGSIYRSSACISSTGLTLYLIATNNQVTQTPVVNFMKNVLVCANGMDFDSNSSTGLIYSGAWKVGPPATVGTGLLIGFRN